jgi:hypothetical protein
MSSCPIADVVAAYNDANNYLKCSALHTNSQLSPATQYCSIDASGNVIKSDSSNPSAKTLAALQTATKTSSAATANCLNTTMPSSTNMLSSQIDNDKTKNKLAPPYTSIQTPASKDETKLYLEWAEYGSVIFATVAGSIIVYIFVAHQR